MFKSISDWDWHDLVSFLFITTLIAILVNIFNKDNVEVSKTCKGKLVDFPNKPQYITYEEGNFGSSVNIPTDASFILTPSSVSNTFVIFKESNGAFLQTPDATQLITSTPNMKTSKYAAVNSVGSKMCFASSFQNSVEIKTYENPTDGPFFFENTATMHWAPKKLPKQNIVPGQIMFDPSDNNIVYVMVTPGFDILCNLDPPDINDFTGNILVLNAKDLSVSQTISPNDSNNHRFTPFFTVSEEHMFVTCRIPKHGDDDKYQNYDGLVSVYKRDEDNMWKWSQDVTPPSQIGPFTNPSLAFGSSLSYSDSILHVSSLSPTVDSTNSGFVILFSGDDFETVDHLQQTPELISDSYFGLDQGVFGEEYLFLVAQKPDGPNLIVMRKTEDKYEEMTDQTTNLGGTSQPNGAPIAVSSLLSNGKLTLVIGGNGQLTVVTAVCDLE